MRTIYVKLCVNCLILNTSQSFDKKIELVWSPPTPCDCYNTFTLGYYLWKMESEVVLQNFTKVLSVEFELGLLTVLLVFLVSRAKVVSWHGLWIDPLKLWRHHSAMVTRVVLIALSTMRFSPANWKFVLSADSWRQWDLKALVVSVKFLFLKNINQFWKN